MIKKKILASSNTYKLVNNKTMRVQTLLKNPTTNEREREREGEK